MDHRQSYTRSNSQPRDLAQGHRPLINTAAASDDEWDPGFSGSSGQLRSAVVSVFV
ncbi:hypothetical protein ABZ348_24405 [Streptomyces sp. NPDC005963]|uniref:hypothetical protein n=1 Tax=Streptomyces sp. NPDC005963 TaxID=3156721 RepID=UPI0033F263FE